MKDTVRKFQTEKGILCEYYDEDATSPRMLNDYSSTFLTFDRRCCSPDRHSFNNFDSYIRETFSDKFADKLESAYKKNINEFVDILIEGLKKRGYIAVPVWKFDHSGVAYRTGFRNPFCPQEDTCFIGFIYETKQNIYKEFKKSCSKSMIDIIVKRLSAEVEEYSLYANGEVYGYRLFDEENNEIDSCWTFYGDDIEKNGVLDCFDIKDYKEII